MGRSIAIGVFAAALCLGAPLAAHSAGLGKLTVLSPLGQPLNAEIEIVSLQPGEEDGLTGKLGSAEAFKQAGIDFNPALLGMRFSIEKRAGRPILKLTTPQAVNEPFLDMLVELQWTTGRLVREYTFLLDPPEYKGPAAVAAAPAPAPKPSAEARPPAPAPAPKPSVAARPVPAAPSAGAKQYQVKKGDTLAGIARENMMPGVTLEQMLISIYRANQDAFIRDNINLVRTGKILNIPADAAGSVDTEDAKRLVQAHQKDFSEYRNRVAAAPAAADASPGRREVTGRIEPKPAPVPQEKQDQLRLSKADPKAQAGQGSRAAGADDQAARERAIKESQSRVTDLEKNVADLQKLLELKNQQLAELEKKGGAKASAPSAAAPVVPAPAAKAPEKPAVVAEAPKPAPAANAPEAPKPAAEAPKPAAEAPKPAAEAPKPAAEAPKPAPDAPKPAAEADKPKPPAEAAKPAAKKAAPPPAPEPSLIDEFLDNPMALGSLGLVVLLLLGYGIWAWRRKKASHAKFQDSVLDAASGAGAASVFGAPAAGAAAAAGVSQASVSQAPAGMEAEEVDPIAEADVYMAYGRDAQAEEILKEALAKDASRTAVHAKLLEIYANRKDAKSFEQTAVKLKGLTAGAGPDWDKAAALGRSIDPSNGLYSGAGEAPPAAAESAPSGAPTLDFDLGGAASAAPAPDISLDDAPKDASGSSVDFDLGAAAAEPAAPTASEEKPDFTPEGTIIMEKGADTTASGLDFDLGLGGDEKKAEEPPAPATPAAADATGGLDFDLNLDMGGEEKAPDAPTQPAPEMDLSSISLDLGGPGEPTAPVDAGAGDPKWQEVATKLDLAKAYEEMGDKDGARELLNEVMKDGDAAQKGQAQQLLAKIG